MTDLFASMEEATTEREAIKAADGIEFDEVERHRCEVSWCIRTFHPGPNANREQMKKAVEAIQEYFALVEKHRGKESADKLRNDCREAWKARKAESCESR